MDTEERLAYSRVPAPQPPEFLPCPFCGSTMVGALQESSVRDPATGRMTPDPHARLGVVGCGVCGCSGPSLWDTAEELAAAWNRRALTPGPASGPAAGSPATGLPPRHAAPPPGT